MEQDLLARLTEVCDVRVWGAETRCPDDVIAKEVTDIEAFLGTNRWNGELMDKAPRLRLIANVGVGYDNVDVDAATERGIIVTNTPEVLTDTTADLAFTLMLAVARRICEANRFIRAGEWKALGGAATFMGRDVHHATLGIVGLGRIGAAVAQRGLGFSMKVLYYDVVRREDLEKQYGYHFVDLDTLLAQADFVSMHMPLMAETRGMIGAAQLAKMKPTAYLINAARGPVVDEQALIEALKTGTIAGAGLDVFEKEPTDPNNPLLKMDNVVALPHIGSATFATRRAMANLAVDNVLAVVQGKPPLTPVNPAVLSRLKK
jgi:glyoxylate reductase